MAILKTNKAAIVKISPCGHGSDFVTLNPDLRKLFHDTNVVMRAEIRVLKFTQIK